MRLGIYWLLPGRSVVLLLKKSPPSRATGFTHLSRHLFLGICQEPTFFHGIKTNEAEMHDLRTRRFVIAGPTAEPADDPCCPGETALSMRIFLLVGFAFHFFVGHFQNRLIGFGKTIR